MKIVMKVENKELIFVTYKMFEQEKNVYLVGIINSSLKQEDILMLKDMISNEENYRHEESALVLETEDKFFYFKDLDFNKLAKKGSNIFQIGFTFIDESNKILEKDVTFFGIEWKLI